MFFLYQLMFIVITVPLMTGAFAGRLNLKGYIILVVCWNLLIYFPCLPLDMGRRIFGSDGILEISLAEQSSTRQLDSVHWHASSHLDRGRFLWAKEISIAVLWQLLSVQVYFWFGWFGFNSGGALRADNQAVNAFGSTFIALAFADGYLVDYCKSKRKWL